MLSVARDLANNKERRGRWRFIYISREKRERETEKERDLTVGWLRVSSCLYCGSPI